MKGGIFFAILFALFLGIEQTAFHAFGGPLALIPLTLITGMIVMQRIGVEEGIAWFLALFLMTGNIGTLCLIGIAPLLILQIFTTRSVYALIGFGISAFVLSSIAQWIICIISDSIFHTTLLQSQHMESTVLKGVLLIPGLFVMVTLLRLIERRIIVFFAFRSSP